MKEAQAAQDQAYVVDDDEAVLDAIRLRLKSEGLSGRYFVTAEELLEALAIGRHPMCIVSDIRLPGMSGLELQIELNTRGIKASLILITGHGEIDMAVKAVKTGAFDFQEKPFDPTRLVESIRDALDIANKQRVGDGDLADLKERVAQLSERQREVMDLAVLGFSNKEIAQQMGISPRTVESYRAWVMEKTGAANLAELVRIAMQMEKMK